MANLIHGKYTTAKIFTDNFDEATREQIKYMCDQEHMKGLKVRIMPDAHKGAGSTIGTTIKLEKKIVPNLVGQDLGCGLSVTNLGKQKIDLDKLDKIIHEHVPSGFKIHEKTNVYNLLLFAQSGFDNIKIAQKVDFNQAIRSLGTLGSGNHVIELSVDTEGNHYLYIHTGSRYYGARIAKYYQDLAIRNHTSGSREERLEFINQLKQEGRHKEIESELKLFNQSTKHVPDELAYLEGEDYDDYLHDAMIAQEYAETNRKAILHTIAKHMGYSVDFIKENTFDSPHNFVGQDGILRKGATSAQKGEKLIIPINMRDGAILATGKGNADWNCSAPHGAGRVLSRRQAKRKLDYDEFKESMSDVYTTTLSEETLDEAPGAYKSMQSILDNIEETAAVDHILRPIYNFKG